MNLPEPKPFDEIIPLFLSYVPDRSTGNTSKLGKGFKLHNQINHAKNAISSSMSTWGRKETVHDMGIWELNMQAQEWELIHYIPAGTKRGELPW